MAITIKPYNDEQRELVLALSMKAWAPVFDEFKPAVAPYVYDAFYPRGWRVRQSGDIKNFLRTDAENVWVATEDSKVLGWAGCACTAKTAWEKFSFSLLILMRSVKGWLVR